MADFGCNGGVMGGQNSLGNEEETAMGIHVVQVSRHLSVLKRGYWDLGSSTALIR